MGLIHGALSAAIPVDPDAATAQDWLRRVLSGSEYQRARPSLFELLRQWVADLLDRVQLPAVPGGPPLLAILIPLLLVVGVLVVAFVRYGLPRLRRRSADSGELFEVADDRTAARLRRDAAQAARSGDWARAIAEQFRALARALADRTVVSIAPGTTAHSVGRSAAAVFPAFGDRLESAASAFDRVRYLDGTGTREEYEALVTLDREIGSARPLAAEVALVGAPR
ncbi:MAG: DUF4129 domain-containing protein [Micrococcales bacterium]|nr:DUF4129 domain-containing protein [Micrococcales bacterium]